MFTWIFNYFKYLRLRKESSLSFGAYRAAQETAYSAMQEIMEVNAQAKQTILTSAKELELLCSKALELQFFKDFLGLKYFINQPVFTVGRAAEIAQKRTWYFLLMLGFIISETFLYYIISGFVIPGLDSLSAKISMSLFFAFLCMFGINWGLESHNKHIYAKQRFDEKKIKPDVLKKINHDRIIGYAVTILCFLFIIAAGMTRIFLVEGAVAPTSFGSTAQAENYAKGSAWISVLTMIFTLVLGFLLAKIKNELFELTPLYKSYKAWLRNKKSTDTTIRTIESKHKKIASNMEITRNKGWQLILDMQNIMGREYDSQDKQLYTEYINDKRQSGFALTDDTFNKYHRLITGFRELYDYTIQHHPDMVSWTTEFDSARNLATEIITKYNQSLPEHAEQPEVTNSHPVSDNFLNENGDKDLKKLIEDVNTKKQNGSINHQKPVKP